MQDCKLTGKILEIGVPTEFKTRDGKTMTRRSLTIDCAHFNMETGRRYENTPQMECIGATAEALDHYRAGDRVEVRFDVRGAAYTDQKTGQRRIFTRISPYKINLLKSGEDAAPEPEAAAPQPNPILQAGGYGDQQLL